MLPEVVGLVGVVVVLGLIGLGPALYAGFEGPRRLVSALGLAPVLGYAVIGLLAFPLARWLAPVQAWAWPVTLLLLAGSGGLVALYWRQQRPKLEWADLVRLGLGALVMAVGILVLARPLLQAGIQFAVYRSNPSDAFLYTSLAETLHSADWATLSGGISTAATNWAGMQGLAAVSPTALFTARMVGLPLALNKMGFLAWAAEISGTPVYRFYYTHHLLALVTSLATMLVLGHRLRLTPLLNYCTAGAMAVGFWAHFLLEADAGYEISALPLLLLAICAWVLTEQAPEKLLTGGRIVMALACAALLATYFPALLIVGGAGAIYYSMAAARTVAWRAAAAHGVTLALVVAILAATGQIDYVARNVIYLIGRADTERMFEPLVLNALRRDGVAGIWGFSAASVAGALPGRLRWPVAQAFALIGAYLTGVATLGLGVGFRRDTQPALRMMAGVVVAGGLLAGVMLLRDNERAAGKAFTYIVPYLFLLTGAAAPHLRRILAAGWQPAAQLALTASFGLQAGLGLVWAYHTLLPAPSPGPPKSWQFDISPLEAYLRANPPRQLLVSIPRGDDLYNSDSWTFAYYTMFPFSQYQAYFQSGIIIDNSLTTGNLWLQAPLGEPDYAVVLKRNDFLAATNLGRVVAETPDLVLYHLTQLEPGVLAAEEQRLRQAEAAKAPPP